MRAELDRSAYNYMAHGVEMSIRYRSAAIVEDGSPDLPPARDPELFYTPSTKPGSYVPHAWLVRREPSSPVSTLDVAGKGAFHIFTGPGGERWRLAAEKVVGELGIAVSVTSIGPKLDYEDPYGDWARHRGVEEDGCVLVRPDLVVGWRSASLPEDADEALLGAARTILGW